MPSPTGLSSKSIGLIAAVVLSILFVVIIVVTMRSTQPTKTTSNFSPDRKEIRNITDGPTGGVMFITMVDKNDPSRIAATLKADQFEPIGQGRRRLDNPESWIYTKDNRAFKITADSATMLMPDPNQAPESGTLEGNITILAYESTPAPGKPAESSATPTMVAHFDEPVEFERRYLRLRSKGHFDITSDQFDFKGTDLTVILNELRDRVELIDVVQGDALVIHTNRSEKSSSSQRVPSTPSPSNDPQTTIATTLPPEQGTDQQTHPSVALKADDTAQPTAPLSVAQAVVNPINRYHITLDDQVVVQIPGSGHANADSLELWAALNGGSLPDDAIRTIAFAQSTPATTTPPAVATRSVETTANPALAQTVTSSPAPKPSTDIVINWTGPLTVRPVDDHIPAHLENDSLALSLASRPDPSSATHDAGITFAIPDRGFTGQSAAATYYATRGVLELESTQTESGIIKLSADRAGSLVASSLRADLASGRIELDGRGQITSTPRASNTNASNDPSQHATIQWKNNAVFSLAMKIDPATQQPSLSDRLTHAHFDGNVIAHQDGNSLGARTLDATLDPMQNPSLALTKISMVDGVLSSASKSLLSANKLDIHFAPNSWTNSVDPIRLSADGQVFGRNPDSMLKADNLITTMHRDLNGDLNIRTANASGNINYTGADRTSAQSTTLVADGLNQTLTLKGQDSKVAQGGSTVTGSHININAKRRGIEVVGPGSFDHDIVLADSLPNTRPQGHLRATWKGAMRFDDAIGSIVCEKDVRIVSTPDAYTRDTLDANRAEIKLTPIPASDPIAGINAPRKQPNTDRKLLSARVMGFAPAGQAPIPAKVESRTYSKDNPELAISLIYLESSQIFANNTNQTLSVPGAGTLLIRDMRDPAVQEPDATPSTNKLSGSGSALTRFTWIGAMNLDRAKGTASMTDQVMVVQKNIDTSKVSTLQTDALNATFELGQQDQSQATRLLSADALGSVRFNFESKELLADNAYYNAIDDSLFASAIDNKRVTYYDPAQSAPTSAKTIKWDLASDRIEINAPTPARFAPGN